MRQQELKAREIIEAARAEKAKRDASILATYLIEKSIHGTRKALDFVYSRAVVRKVISKAGVYDKCKRERLLINKTKQRPSKSTWEDRSYSRTHGSELKMQLQADKMLKDEGVAYPRHIQREVQVPGCQMRADLSGYNWAIEAKRECTSQGILTAMAQCLVYRKHLQKKYVCILLPDDIDPAAFYVSECLSHGIPIIKMSQLVWWVNTVQNDAQPN